MTYRILDSNTPSADLQRYLFSVSELIKTVNESLRGTELYHTLRERTPKWLMDRLQSRSHRAFIVVATSYESPNQLIGCYLVTGARSSSDFPNLQHIGWSGSLACHPDYRRMGIGKGLLNESFREAQKRNLTEFVTETEEKNIPALDLFKRFGYMKGTPYPWAIWSEYWSENDRILEVDETGRILRYRWTTPENRQTIMVPLHKKLS